MSSYRKTMREAREEMLVISEAKYELYHKDFSGAMKHAYHVAKKHHGITIDPSEIDDKVATGPKKPSEGKTNKYRLKGDKGAVQIQVYNKGGSKPFELNMYKEEVELGEAKFTVKYDKNGKNYTDTIMAKDKDDAVKKWHLKGIKGNKFSVRPVREEVELDEGFKTGDKVKIDTEFEGETHNGQSGVIHKVGTGRNKGAYTVKFSDGKVQSYDDEELIKEEVDLDEGTWALPKTPKEMAALKKLLSKPLKAKDASDKLYDIIGDDEMSDDLDDYADKNPNDDIRPMVKSHMKRLGIKEEVKALTPTGEYSRYREEKDLTKKVKGSTMTMTGKKSDEIDTKPEIDKEK